MQRSTSRFFDPSGHTRSLAGLAIALVPGVAGAQSHEIFWESSEITPTAGARAIASVGDLDGDGVSDIVAGNPDFDGGSNVGRIVALSGADASVIFEVIGPEPPGRFGSSVAGIGDINGDGVPDLAVGSETAEGFNGTVQVISGADPEKTIFTATGATFSALGITVAGLGDVNADGVPDYAAGEPGIQGFSNEGLVKVFSGADGSILYQVSGEVQVMGGVIANAGDVNGDGVDDLITGVPSNAIGGPFPVRLFSGVDGTQLAELSGVFSFGQSVGSIGDVTADGRAEFIIATPIPPPEDDPNGPIIGRVGVYTLLDDGSPEMLFEVVGEQPEVEPGEGPTRDFFGASVAGPGDLDGDGTPDLLVSAPTDDEQTHSDNNGILFAFSGADGTELFRIIGSRRQTLGSAIGTADDLNADGIPDFFATGRFDIVAFASAAPDCPADIDGNGTLNADDFFDFLALFASRDPTADLTGPSGDGEPDGAFTADDFFFYLGLFAAGCP